MTTELSAAIVHTDLGPTGLPLGYGAFNLDLNADLRADLQLQYQAGDRWITTCRKSTWTTTSNGQTYTFTSSDCTDRLVGTSSFRARGAGPSNKVVANGGFAFALDGGNSIHAQRPLANDALLASQSWSEFNGSFQNTRAFLGVLFVIEPGDVHAGWLDIEKRSYQDPIIYGYAYETEPGKAIAAGAVPEPPALALLAAGAAGLAVLRKKRSAHG